MAKSKKLKKYKAPDAKFLVVIDPWPTGQAGHPRFIENVAAWFEFMLRDDHPGETVRTVFTQGTHNNIIVELSESVDIQSYIGVHAHRRFLTPPYDDTEAVSYIYEYDYETQNDPARRSWTARYPSSYDTSIFPFKMNYPIPTPAPLPPFHINYVKRPRVTSPPAAIVVQDHPVCLDFDTDPHPDISFLQEPPPSDASTMRSRTSLPLLREDHEEAKPVVKKRDPYEEDDDARLLRTESRDLRSQQEQDPRSNSVDFVKKEPISHVVPSSTHEVGSSSSNVVDVFLASILVKKEEPMNDVSHQSVSIKEEPSDPQVDDSLASIPVEKSMNHVNRQSVPTKQEPLDSHVDDLLASIPIKREESMSQSHRSVSINEEPVDAQDKEYHPSAELLAAFADLSAAMSNPFPAISPGPVKSERTEPSDVPNRSRRERLLATEAEENDRRSRSENAQILVKPEPQDGSLPPPLLNRSRDLRERSMTFSSNRSMTFSPNNDRPMEPTIKPEPQDNYPIPTLARAPDPRSVGSQTQEKRRMEEMNYGRTRSPVSATAQMRDLRLARDRWTQPSVIRDPRLSRREQGGQSSKRYNGRDEAEGERMKRIKTEE